MKTVFFTSKAGSRASRKSAGKWSPTKPSNKKSSTCSAFLEKTNELSRLSAFRTKLKAKRSFCSRRRISILRSYATNSATPAFRTYGFQKPFDASNQFPSSPLANSTSRSVQNWYKPTISVRYHYRVFGHSPARFFLQLQETPRSEGWR